MQDILPEQFVFTYIDTRGNINKPLHADYLNNKMKSIRKRHKELAYEALVEELE